MLLAIVASWLTLGNVDFACETPEVPVILTHETSNYYHHAECKKGLATPNEC